MKKSGVVGGGLTQCAVCGTSVKPEDAQLNHINPRSAGGSSKSSNIQVVCKRCNLIKAASTLASLSQIGDLAGRKWAESFIRSPYLTSAISAVISAAAAIIFIFASPRVEDDSVSFSEQRELLSQTERSLDQLSNFIAAQQKSMEAERRAIDTLQRERRALEPLVGADRRVVENLFLMQERRASDNAKRERLIGFIIGFFASIAASAFLAGLGMLIRKKLVSRDGSQ